MPYPYTVRIPYALELHAIIGNRESLLHPKQYGHTGVEFDAELEVGYESPDNWEITGLRFEQTRWNPEFTVTAESDPDLWKLIERAIDLDDKRVAARVIEAGEEEIAACRADYGDYLLEQRRDREAGL